MSLSERTIFESIDNLDVNPNNPFPNVHLTQDTSTVSMLTSGTQTVMKTCIKMQRIFFFLSFSLLMSQQKATIAPLSFVASLPNQGKQNKKSDWRTLCFTPGLSVFEGNAEHESQSGKSKSTQCVLCRHRKLHCTQERFIIDKVITIPRRTKVAIMEACCCLILGDTQRADAISGSSSNCSFISNDSLFTAFTQAFTVVLQSGSICW